MIHYISLWLIFSKKLKSLYLPQSYDVVTFGNKIFYLDRKAIEYKNKMRTNILTGKISLKIERHRFNHIGKKDPER